MKSNASLWGPVLAWGTLALCGLTATPAWAQAPTGLTVKAATRQRVDLTWNGTAASYTLQRATLGGSFSNIATVSTTSASDTSVDPYTTYQYQVVNAGSTAASNQVIAGPPPAGFTVAAKSPGPPGSELTSSYGYDLSMVLDANGDPAFAFIFYDPNQDSNGADSLLLFRSWNRARYAWNPLVTVGTVGDVATYFTAVSSLAYDSSTNTFAVASGSQTGDNQAAKVFVSADGGATWSLKATFADGQHPSLALAGGNIYLAFQIDFEGVKYVTGKLSDPQANWQTKAPAVPSNTNVAFASVAPSIAVDSNGVPAVAYWVPDTKVSNVLLFWRPTTGSLVRVLDSQDQQSDELAVRLLFYKQNPRVVTYVQRKDADFGVGIHFVRSDDGGLTWATPVVISPDGDSSTDYPFDMAFDSQGHGAIAFGQNSGSGDTTCGNPKLALSTDLLTWKTCAAADVSITGNYESFPGSIALLYGGNDKLYLGWWQQGDNGTGVGILLYREPPTGTASAPSITAGGVVSGATFLPGIVGGSWVTIVGANFTDVTTTWANADFSNNRLPTSLGGVQVKIGGLPAAVYYVSATQLNVQAPAPISGTVDVQVTHNGAVSNTVTATALPNAPGFFAYTVGSKTFPAAVFLDGVIVGDPALNFNTRKAKPGDHLQLYATGLVSSPSGIIINAPIGTSGVTATIGTTPVTVEYSGLVAVGEFQINIQVPQLPDGDYPLVLKIAGQSTQTVTLPIAH